MSSWRFSFLFGHDLFGKRFTLFRIKPQQAKSRRKTRDFYHAQVLYPQGRFVTSAPLIRPDLSGRLIPFALVAELVDALP
jgi:hypothetical protein